MCKHIGQQEQWDGVVPKCTLVVQNEIMFTTTRECGLILRSHISRQRLRLSQNVVD